MAFKAVKCNCGRSGCPYWNVSPVAMGTGVKFTEAQALHVAGLLNISDFEPHDNVAGYKIMVFEVINEPMPLEPIHTHEGTESIN